MRMRMEEMCGSVRCVDSPGKSPGTLKVSPRVELYQKQDGHFKI